MGRHVPGLSLWLVFALMPAAGEAAPAMPATITITFAEQPVRLSRDTAMYSARRGTVLQPDDLIASGAGTILLDAGGATIAIGPASAVYIRDRELVLLDGWLKVDGSAARTLLLTTAGMQVDSAGVAATLHATPGSTGLFVESGAPDVVELPAGKAPRRVKVPREQFAVRVQGQPLKLAARPPAAFLAGMPRAFLDPLVALAFKGPSVAPKREGPATFAALAPLLAGQPALRQQMQARFAPPRPARTAPRPQQPTNNLF